MCETLCFVFWVLSVLPFFLSLCCDDPASISPRWSNCEYCVFHLGCNQLNLPETRLQSCWKDFNLWRSTTSTESNPSENHSTIHLPEKLEPMSIKKYWFHWWGKCVKTTLDFWSKETFSNVVEILPCLCCSISNALYPLYAARLSGDYCCNLPPLYISNQHNTNKRVLSKESTKWSKHQQMGIEQRK